MRSKQTPHVHLISGGPLSPLGKDAEDMSWEGGSVLTAPPFGYSPELPLRRPGGPNTRPAFSATRMPPGIVRSLRRLRGLHLRFSLCRVSLVPGCDSRLTAIDDRSLIVELAADGSLIVIYIHPRGVNDEEADCGLSARLEQALRQSGVPLNAVRISVLPCDAAAIDVNDISLAAMGGQASRPLINLPSRSSA